MKLDQHREEEDQEKELYLDADCFLFPLYKRWYSSGFIINSQRLFYPSL